MLSPAIDQSIMRIRSHLQSPGVTKRGLADAAGVHPNTLQGVERPDWNPTAGTLRALEAQLPSPPAPGTMAESDSYTQALRAVSGRNASDPTPGADEPVLPLAGAHGEPELPIIGQAA